MIFKLTVTDTKKNLSYTRQGDIGYIVSHISRVIPNIYKMIRNIGNGAGFTTRVDNLIITVENE